MKQDVKELWVNALRSGEYEQARRKLSVDGKYCCLGVLCDLASKNGVPLDVEERNYLDPNAPTVEEANKTLKAFDGESTVLPSSVIGWARLSDEEYNPQVLKEYYDGSEELCLAALNDTGFTFDQIADIIEWEM